MPRRPPPPMPKEVIQAAIANDPYVRTRTRRKPLAIWDAHVHFWATPRILTKLDWNHTPQTQVVQDDHDAQRYMGSLAESKVDIAGLTYVQIEIKHDIGVWEHAIDEMRWLVVEQLPQIPHLMAISAWAPLPEGQEAMASYCNQLREVMKHHYTLLKGFRYLLQEYPPGHATPMLQPLFIEGLKWLGGQELVFEITVDTRNFGEAVYTDVLRCMEEVRKDQPEGRQTRFIIDHIAKVDLGSALTRGGAQTLDQFEKFLTEIAFMPHVYVKCSGYLSQLPPTLVQQALSQPHSDAYKGCKSALSQFIMPLLEALGEDRLIWGSDWPICKLGVVGQGTLTAVDEGGSPEEVQKTVWTFAYKMLLDVLVEAGLSDQALDKIFCANAKRFYKIAYE